MVINSQLLAIVLYEPLMSKISMDETFRWLLISENLEHQTSQKAKHMQYWSSRVSWVMSHIRGDPTMNLITQYGLRHRVGFGLVLF